MMRWGQEQEEVVEGDVDGIGALRFAIMANCEACESAKCSIAMPRMTAGLDVPLRVFVWN